MANGEPIYQEITLAGKWLKEAPKKKLKMS